MPCVGTFGTKESIGSSHLELELKAPVGHLTWVLGCNTGPLEEQCMLSAAEPSLQPQMNNSLYSGRAPA